MIPGSHHWAPINVPYVNQGDWEPEPLSAEDQARVPADLGAPYPGEVLVTAPAGSAIICNSSMWHSGTVKHDDRTGACCTSPTPAATCRSSWSSSITSPASLYDRMSPAHRYLLEIEPPTEGEGVLRHPKRESQGLVELSAAAFFSS